MKKVAAVVVTYNRKALLLENIESLLSQTKKRCFRHLCYRQCKYIWNRERVTSLCSQ